MTTQLEVAKEALAQIGTRSKITSLTDGSAEATYVSLLYNPIRDFLLTEGDYDFSLNTITPVELSDDVPPWAYAYAYPADVLRVRQVIPARYDDDKLDPHPVEWNILGDLDTRQIMTSEKIVLIMCTKPAIESLWDPIFRQSFVRMLASALAFALENRIEASKIKLDEALGFAGIGKMRDS